MKKYYDCEHNVFITETELRAEYEKLRKDGETEQPSFESYQREVTGKNGTLEVM